MFNIEQYIEECIDSVLNQNIDGIQIICVNDGSVDDTLKKIDKYKENITIISYDDNKGASHARNIGLQNAIGEYVYFLDGDDMLVRGALNKLYKILVEDDLDAVFFGRMNINELDRKIYHLDNNVNYNFTHTSELIMTGKELLKERLLAKKLSFGVWQAIWRKEFLLGVDTPFIEGIIHEDIPWTLRHLSLANRVKVIHKDFYIRRYREGSITVSEYKSHNLISLLVGLYHINTYYKSGIEMSFMPIFRDIVELIIDFVREVYDSLDCSIDELKNHLHTGIQEIDDYIYISMAYLKRIYVIDTLDTSIIEKLKQYNKIYIYGAGKVAKDALLILSRRSLVVRGFVVSDLHGNPPVIQGHRVMEVPDIDTDDSIVLIAVKSHRKQIEQNLIKHNIQSFIYYL